MVERLEKATEICLVVTHKAQITVNFAIKSNCEADRAWVKENAIFNGIFKQAVSHYLNLVLNLSSVLSPHD